MLISLTGNNGVYEFDSSNPASVIQTQRKFSALYRGTRKEDGLLVTLKHLRDSSSIQGSEHKDLIFMVLQSIQSLHPGIVNTLDIIETESGYFIVREYLHGVDVKTIICTPDYSHVQTPIFSCMLTVQVCEILQKLHEHGIVHRDIKPSNIFVETEADGRIDPLNLRVRLIDLELAQVHGANIFSLKKVPFALIYSPPEQVLRHAHLIDNRSDLYSLALVAYEIITRRPPFYHENPELLMNLQINQPLVRTSRISKDMLELLHKATSKHKFPLPPNKYRPENLEFFLAKGREGRFQSAEEMKEAFQQKYDELYTKLIKKQQGGFFRKYFS